MGSAGAFHVCAGVCSRMGAQSVRVPETASCSAVDSRHSSVYGHLPYAFLLTGTVLVTGALDAMHRHDGGLRAVTLGTNSAFWKISCFEIPVDCVGAGGAVG